MGPPRHFELARCELHGELLGAGARLGPFERDLESVLARVVVGAPLTRLLVENQMPGFVVDTFREQAVASGRDGLAARGEIARGGKCRGRVGTSAPDSSGRGLAEHVPSFQARAAILDGDGFASDRGFRAPTRNLSVNGCRDEERGRGNEMGEFQQGQNPPEGIVFEPSDGSSPLSAPQLLPREAKADGRCKHSCMTAVHADRGVPRPLDSGPAPKPSSFDPKILVIFE